MRLNKIWTIFTKEYEDVIKSRYVLLSLILMPFFMIIVLPLSTYIPMLVDTGPIDSGEAEFFMQFAITQNWEQLSEQQRMFVVFVEFNWLYYLLLPIILPTIIAADSFSGEKDRGTVEGLVAAPLTETELYVGKISTSLIPTVASVWIYSIPYALVTNVFANRILGYPYFPSLRFIVVVIFLMPLTGLISINIMIWASTRTTTTRDAQQLGSLLILPLMIVLLNIVGVAIIFSDIYLILGGVVMMVLSLGAVKVGISLLDRERWLSHTS